MQRRHSTRKILTLRALLYVIIITHFITMVENHTVMVDWLLSWPNSGDQLWFSGLHQVQTCDTEMFKCPKKGEERGTIIMLFNVLKQ
jgi:hypothetical protein